MEFDLVVRNGLVVDGSGAPGFRADVGVLGDRIVAVGEALGAGVDEIDADGLVVAPGFVDGHTHMDAQVFWDELGSSSCWHGVSTVVMGNCGFTLAPARPEERPLVVRNLERAEDIPREALAAGVPWSWSTFAEYLDAVDAVPKGLNYAALIGHSALRTFAMGERAFEESASPDDLETMAAELRHALEAGAFGLSTSRSWTHTTSDDRPVASRLASWDEVEALVGVVGRHSDGAFQLAMESGGSREDSLRRVHDLQELALATGVPILFGLFAIRGSSLLVDVIDDTARHGGEMYGLTHCRGVSLVHSFRTRLPFDILPEWQAVRSRPLDEQRRLLLDPDVRRTLVQAAYEGDYGPVVGAEPRKPDFDALYLMFSPYLDNPTVAEEARRRGVDPVEVMIDVALETDFEIFFLQSVTRQPEEKLLALLRHPNTAMTFSDAGAHVTQILDASIQTHLLAYWVRERGVLSLEEAIRMITSQPARVWRLRDRGFLAPGYGADLTVFDPETVAPLLPQLVNDLPGGMRRLVQRAQGYAATIVNGQVLTRDGEPTEARPGRLLRAGALAAS